jgi:chromate transporter
VLGRRTIMENGWNPDWVKVAILIGTVLLLVRFKKLPEPIIIIIAAAIGLLIH